MEKVIQQIINKMDSLFFRILLFFLSLNIPILLIGFTVYIYSVDATERDFSDKIQTNLAYSTNMIDVCLKASYETSINFFSDDIVVRNLRPANVMGLDERIEIVKIPPILSRNSQLVSEYIDKIFVFVDSERIYTSEGVEEFSSFFSNYYHYDEYDENFWKIKLGSIKNFEILKPSTVKTIKSTSMKQVIPIVSIGNVYGYKTIMVVNISVNTIVKAIQDNSMFKASKIIVLDKNNNFIASNDENYFTGDVIKFITNFSQDVNAKNTRLKLYNEKVFLDHLKSDKFQWNYFILTPAKEFNMHSQNILKMTVMICTILIILGIGFSFIFSINIYNPIRNIRTILNDKENELGTNQITTRNSKDELEIIRAGISRLAEGYKYKIKTISNKFLDSMFYSLFRGNFIENEELLKNVLVEGYGFNNKSYLCIALILDFKETFYKEIQDVDRIQIYAGMKKVIWSIIGESINTYMLEMKRNLFIVVANINGEDERTVLLKSLGNIRKTFEYDSRYCRIAIGIGKESYELNDIVNSYNYAISAAMESSKGNCSFRVVDSKDILVANNYFYSFMEENRILNCLKTCDRESLTKVLEEIIGTNIEKKASHIHMNMLFMELYKTGIRYVAEKGFNFEEFDKDSRIYMLGNVEKDMEDVGNQIESLMRFYSDIMEKAKDGSTHRTGSLVTMIIKYIEENYSKDIYLEKIADKMGVSVKYVSRIFKEKTGENISNYINSVRIAKAKEFITTTNMNIQDIAKKVGIENRTTFLRIFKSLEGTSPSNYREFSSER